MKVLVIGATGAIGRCAVPKLVADGHEVTAAGRSRPRLAALEKLGATAVELDLFDGAAARRAMRDQQAVINLSTRIPTGYHMFMPGAWRETNRIRGEGSRILVDAALDSGVERFVQESFAPAYPDRGSEWITEETPLAPTRYAHAVPEAEASAERFTRAGRIGVVLRFAFLYGPGDPFATQLFDSVKRGWFPMFGRPEGYLPMVTHDDAGAAVAASLRVPAGAYNVVDDDPKTRREVAGAIAQLLGVKMPRFLPSWAAKLAGSLGETVSRSERISNRKLEKASGWAPRYPTVREGLAMALARV